MKISRVIAPLFLLAGLTAVAGADSTVTLSDVHLCCGKCVSGVTAAVKPVTGASATSDMAAKTVVITAPDAATVQKAVDALVAAGYYGKSSDDKVKLNADTGAKDEKVKTLDITGVHLCCNSCVTALKGVIDKVPGITANTAKANATSFTLSGDFNAKTFMDELQKAGLTGKVATK